MSTLTREDLLSNDQKIFRMAKNRLHSFNMNDWPQDAPVDAQTLAEAGFFLQPRQERKEVDEVLCNFCRKTISNWKAGDDPFQAHLKNNPRCDFMMGYHVGNIPLDGKVSSDPIRGRNRRINREPDVFGPGIPMPSTLSSSSAPSFFFNPHSSEESSSQENSSQGSSGSESGSPTMPLFLSRRALGLNNINQHIPPSFPGYVTINARLATYPKNWKDVCPIDAKCLAEAGFFYDGPVNESKACDSSRSGRIEDVVVCFHCRQRVCDWESTDDPWEEHKKWAPTCYFLRLNFMDSAHRKSTSTELKSLGKDLIKLSQQYEDVRSTDSSGQHNCKVCWDNEVEILFLPCRHATCCGRCATSVTRCPTCRGNIEGTVRIYLS